ncbi:MAG: penicillin-binding protein 2 [Firmicutes bacterium]|nr:penicillin-binding protein 2 [Bacillota bacterium]
MATPGSDSKQKSRMFIAALIITLIMIGLFARLLWLQLTKGEEYEKAIRSQMGASYSEELAALRGSIYDRNGSVLAQSERVYHVVIDPKMLQEADLVTQQSTINELSKILNVRDNRMLEKFLQPEYKDSQYEHFAAGYNISEAKKELIEDRIASGDVAGVWFEEIQRRNYPGNELASHVIGFNSAYGLEYYYDSTLSGNAGRRMRVAGPNGEYDEEVVEPSNGYSLVTTLDQTMQYYLEESLLAAIKKENALRAVGILMNPKTGEVYAMASYPTFDLNDPEKVIGLTSKYKLEDTRKPDFLPNLWMNSAVNWTYQPGSTYKPIFAASALDNGSITEKDKFDCHSEYYYYDMVFKCAYNEAHGEQTIRQIIQNSCNIGMIQVSQLISTEEYYQYQVGFGIGSATGIDLPAESSGYYLVYNLDNMGPVERATTAFGQGFNLTPIQMITAGSAAVNDGKLMQPYIVSKIVDENGRTIRETQPRVVRQVISADTSAIIRDGMEAVVEGGTGTGVQLEGYRIGGKTGTAEKGDYAEHKYVVSFLGFAPMDDPQIAILIILDEADSNNTSGAQSVAAEVLAKTLPYMNIYPVEEGKE